MKLKIIVLYIILLGILILFIMGVLDLHDAIDIAFMIL